MMHILEYIIVNQINIVRKQLLQQYTTKLSIEDQSKRSVRFLKVKKKTNQAYHNATVTPSILPLLKWSLSTAASHTADY